MIEFIIVFIVVLAFGAGAVTGWNARQRAAERKIAAYVDQIHQQMEENTVQVTVSQEGDTFLIHNQQTGEFLAQGTSYEDVTRALQDRFPSKTFTCTRSDLDKIMVGDGTS